MPVITDLTCEQLPGYEAAMREVAGRLEALADRCRALPQEAVIIGIEQVQAWADDMADMVPALINNTRVALGEEDRDEQEQEREEEREEERRTILSLTDGRPSAIYTAERRALIAEMWGRFPRATVLAEVNKLPGPKIPTAQALGQEARKMGLTTAEGVRRLTVEAAPAPAAPPAPARAPTLTVTVPEMPAAATGVAILNKAGQTLALLPAKPMPPEPAPAAAEPEAPPSPPKPTVPPVPPVPPHRVRPEGKHWRPTAEEEAEAMAMLRQGHTARTIQDQMGGPMSFWSNWCHDNRAKARA